MALPVSKADKIVIAVALTVAVVSLFLINFMIYNGAPTGVEIELDGKPYASYSFSELPREKTLEISTAIGYNIIRIVDNTVVITKSSCNDGLCCEKTISKPSQTLICLPNRLTVRLVGEKKVDSVSY